MDAPDRAGWRSDRLCGAGRLRENWPLLARGADEEATDLENVITDMLDGQYNDPVGVIGFNTAEGSARDVSEDVAEEIRRRCDLQASDVPVHLSPFIARHENRDRAQLRLV